MNRYAPRQIALLMAREIDPQESAPEDDEYIGEWVPEHSCGGVGDPTCAACWMNSYDAAVNRGISAGIVEIAREHLSRVHGVNLPAKIIRSTLEAAVNVEIRRQNNG